MVYSATRRLNAISIAALIPLEQRVLASATMYVSPAGSDGNGDGSAASPFATLQHAANLTQPGDTVIAEPGNYAGFVLGWDDPQAGAVGAPITYEAMPGATIVSRNNKTADGIDLEPGNSNINITGFTINNADGSISRAAIRVTGSDNVNISNNTCDGAGYWGIFTSHSNYTLIDSNITRNSINQHGIYVSNSSDHPTIVNNLIYDNADCGIHLNGDGSEGGLGLITNALIENNTIFGNGADGGSAINGDGLTHSIIENNLLYDNHASGISLYQEDASAGATDNVIANNTIAMASDARWAININSASTGNSVFGNVLFNANPNHGAISITSDSLDGFSSDDNLVNSRFEIDDTIMSDAAWQAQTGDDADSIANPQNPFVDPSSGNYHLAASQTLAPQIEPGGDPTRAVGHVDSGLIQLEFDAADTTQLDWIARGTSGADLIDVQSAGNGVVRININGVDRGEMAIDALSQIQILAGAGRDTIVSSADVSIPLMIRGGAGADFITAATNFDTVCGGKGPDTIFAMGNDDQLYGGRGADCFSGNASDSITGVDALDSIQGIDVVTMLAA